MLQIHYGRISGRFLFVTYQFPLLIQDVFKRVNLNFTSGFFTVEGNRKNDCYRFMTLYQPEMHGIYPR